MLLLVAFILRAQTPPLLSRLIALACDSTWVTSFSNRRLKKKKIYQSHVLTALTWPVPHETAAVSVRSVYTIQPCTMSLHIKSHIHKVYASLAVTCHSVALLAEWPGSCTCYCGNWRGWNGYRNKSQRKKSWPWRRKFARRSRCRDSNPRPFNHESGALTTELSSLPCSVMPVHGPSDSPALDLFSGIMRCRKECWARCSIQVSGILINDKNLT